MYILGTYQINNLFLLEKMIGLYKQTGTAIDCAFYYNNIQLIDSISGFDIPKIYKVWPSIDNSRELDYLRENKKDTICIHYPNKYWKTLLRKIDTNVGVSNFNIKSLTEFKYIKGYYPLYNEIEFNVNCVDSRLIDFCNNHGIKIYGWGLFERGEVFKKYPYSSSDYIKYANDRNVIPVITLKNKQQYLEAQKVSILNITRKFSQYKIGLDNN